MPHLIIKSRLPMRRRGGLAFTSRELSVAVADLSADQLAAINSDPMLIVRRLDSAAPAVTVVGASRAKPLTTATTAPAAKSAAAKKPRKRAN